MQDHTRTRARDARRAPGTELLDMASQIAWSHHERFDGGGYPVRATPASEIPLAGRIAAVADAFDAMTTDRVYRPALTRRARGGDVARGARAPVRPGGRRRVPRVARRRRCEIRERFAPPPAELSVAPSRPRRTRRSRSRPPPTRSRSPPAGCGAGPTRGGSRVDPHRRRASPLPAARPSGGSPPSAASGRACGRSSRPASPLPTLAGAAAQRRDGRWRRPRRPRSTARARRAGSRRRPPGPDLRDWLSAMCRGQRQRPLRGRAAGHRGADAARAPARVQPARAARVPGALRARSRCGRSRARARSATSSRTRGGCSPRSSRALLDSDG